MPSPASVAPPAAAPDENVEELDGGGEGGNAEREEEEDDVLLPEKLQDDDELKPPLWQRVRDFIFPCFRRGAVLSDCLPRVVSPSLSHFVYCNSQTRGRGHNTTLCGIMSTSLIL